MRSDDRELDDEIRAHLAAALLAAAAIVASLLPAARASRVTVLQALRLE